MRSWGSRGCGWVVSQSTTFLMTNEMSSLFFFFFFRENYGTPEKVSYDFFFFLFQDILFKKDYFI